MRKIEIQQAKVKIELPDCWEELTYEQFLAAISLLIVSKSVENISPLAVQVEFLKTYIEYQPGKKEPSPEDSEQIKSNLAIMADAFSFFHNGSEPNFKFRKWMSPDFTSGNEIFPAPYYEIMNTGADVILTNITAEQFTDAWEYYNMYLQTSDITNLTLLTAVLYSDNNYTPKNVAHIAAEIRSIPEVEIYSIFLQFKSIIDYVTAHPVFGILFSGGAPADPDKISLGIGGQIFTLATKGYGDVNTIAKKPFTELLALMLDMLICDVRTMKAYDMKVTEIAKKTKLSVQTINKLI